jgi:hypothetical protein
VFGTGVAYCGEAPWKEGFVKFARMFALVLVVLYLTPVSAGEDGFWKKYTDYWDGLLEKVIELDLYGVTAQLPQGIFSVKYEWNMRNAGGRYDSNRNRTPMAPPISFGEEGSELLIADLGASGGGGGITMQFSYGITDMLDFYFELPFIYLDVQLRPKLRKVDPGANLVINSYLPEGYPQLDPSWFDGQGFAKDEFLNEASAWFLRYLPRLGRPGIGDPDNYPEDLGPGAAYHSNGWILNDINLGFSWNFFRSHRWSGAFTGRVSLPTGNIANPNESLTMGTGPKVDFGTGSFGIGFTQGYDLRVYNYEHWVDIIVSAEFSASYFFKSHRKYPDFPKPTADGNRLLDLLDAERNYFPDLSDLTGKSFGYTPGFGADAMVTLGISSLIFDVGVGIGYSYTSEPEFEADWRFIKMVQALELTLAGHYEILRVAAGINLIPFYVPLQIHYQYEKNIGGRNTLFFTDNHWITVQGYFPTMF